MTQDIPWQELFAVAARVQGNAHVPYSHFPVGAAVLTEGDAIYPGCNVENSTYGLTVCAERNAVARAVVEGKKSIRALAIIANTSAPCPPCGMCRQVLAEFAAPDVPVRTRTPSGQEQHYTLRELLPFAFTRDFL